MFTLKAIFRDWLGLLPQSYQYTPTLTMFSPLKQLTHEPSSLSKCVLIVVVFDAERLI